MGEHYCFYLIYDQTNVIRDDFTTSFTHAITVICYTGKIMNCSAFHSQKAVPAYIKSVQILPSQQTQDVESMLA